MHNNEVRHQFLVSSLLHVLWYCVYVSYNSQSCAHACIRKDNLIVSTNFLSFNREVWFRSNGGMPRFSMFTECLIRARYIHTYACVYTCIYLYILACIYLYICVCVYTHIFIAVLYVTLSGGFEVYKTFCWWLLLPKPSTNPRYVFTWLWCMLTTIFNVRVVLCSFLFFSLVHKNQFQYYTYMFVLNIVIRISTIKHTIKQCHVAHNYNCFL